MRKKIVMAGGVILLLLALAQIWGSAQGQSPSQASTATSSSVTGDLQSEPAVEASGLRLEGRLVPRQWVALAPLAASRAAEIYTREGDQVEAGQVLIRSDQYTARQAEVNSASLEVQLAKQALEDLQRRAGVELAQAEVELTLARDEQALARDLYKSLSAPIPQERIDQAHANLLLSENRLEQARDNLAKLQKKYANKYHILWYFINKRQFRLLLVLKEREVADYERRYIDAKDKYEDLLKPTDPVDLAQAEARWYAAEKRLADARRRHAELSAGPDPDELELAQARLRVAESSLAAAQTSLRQAEVIAPFSGQVVDLAVKPGEWMPAGTAVITLADLSRWKVESTDLGEIDLPGLEVGQPVRLSLDALPDLELNGTVESIGQVYLENDGDIYYSTEIALETSDPALRWGMTVQIDIR